MGAVFEWTGFAVLYSVVIVGGLLLLGWMVEQALRKWLIVTFHLEALAGMHHRAGFWQRAFRRMAFRRPERELAKIHDRAAEAVDAYLRHGERWIDLPPHQSALFCALADIAGRLEEYETFAAPATPVVEHRPLVVRVVAPESKGGES